MGLKQLIGKIAKETVDASNPVQILSATVVSAPPEISIKLKNNDKLIFEKESLLIAEKLTTHSKKMRITSSNANLSGAVINSAMSLLVLAIRTPFDRLELMAEGSQQKSKWNS
ncbi:DUF2577 family protein [Geomicrobium sp. JCM 19039]|uniref:DUF2577 family protein n=1 Tax=Geomicrobium sp. JCM 19039 TaxID=1460636 RepID=UPI0005A80F3E|nr:DUF2577 family protein [Geomicrobium sp. JCM 19039]